MKKKTKPENLVAPSKHGAHVQATSQRSNASNRDIKSIDKEDPLEASDPDQLPWESDEDRILRDESEDPDSPTSL